MKTMTLNELLNVACMENVRVKVKTGRLMASIDCDMTDTAQLDELVAAYGEHTVTEIMPERNLMIVTIKKARGAA